MSSTSSTTSRELALSLALSTFTVFRLVIHCLLPPHSSDMVRHGIPWVRRRTVRMHSSSFSWFIIVAVLAKVVDASWAFQAPSASTEEVPSAILRPAGEPHQRRIQGILAGIAGGSIPSSASAFGGVFVNLLREVGIYIPAMTRQATALGTAGRFLQRRSSSSSCSSLVVSFS